MWELKENVYPRAPAPEEEKGLLTQPFLFIDILQNASYVSIKTNQLIDSLSLTNKDNGYVISIKSDDAKEPINFIALNHGKHGIAASETEETYLEKCVKQQQKQYNACGYGNCSICSQR